jgi:exosortase A
MTANVAVQGDRLRAWADAAREGGWPGHLAALAFATAATLALFSRDAADMVSIWWTASTYNHCMIVPFLAAWLVSLRRAEVVRLAPAVWLPGAALILLAGSVWMAGWAAGLAVLRHIGLVMMLQSLVVTLLGLRVTRALLFPIAYLAFMVPIGEELVPTLQTVTAHMSMALLGLLGVPAHLDGIFITIPNGLFKVAEACAGVKFLVAMIAYGALVANVCFRSWPRRAAFMLVCLIVPVLVNGLRAAGTIYAAHLTTAEAAAGFDHVIYGWVFFGLVMMLVMAIGWRFFDRRPGDPWLIEASASTDAPASRPWPGLALALAALLIAPAWQAAASAAGQMPMPRAIALPAVPGWKIVPPANQPAWVPRFAGADHQLFGHYAGANGERVDLAIALYAWQEEGRELVGYGQGAAGLDGDAWVWSADAADPPGGRGERLRAPGPVHREAVTFHRLDGITTGKAGQVKLATLKARLLGGDQAAATIIVSAVDRDGRPAHGAIDAFLTAMGRPETLADRLIAQARGR